MTHQMTSTTVTETIKQIEAGVLNVGYAEAGPADGPAVLLLHGWPYDIHSYADVAPLLAARGLPGRSSRTCAATARRASSRTTRSATASSRPSPLDAIALMDALEIERAIVAGFDWGARTANVVAALWPERCKGARLRERLPDRQPGSRQGAVAAGGRAPVVVPVLLRHRARPGRLREVPARVRQAHLADRVAAVGLRRRHLRSQRGVARQPGSRRDRDPQLPLAARVWPRASRSTTSWSSGSPQAPADHRARRSPSKATPTARRTRTPSAYAQKFSGSYAHRTITGGIGHNLPQEAPEAFAQAVIDVDAY